MLLPVSAYFQCYSFTPLPFTLLLCSAPLLRLDIKKDILILYSTTQRCFRLGSIPELLFLVLLCFLKRQWRSETLDEDSLNIPRRGKVDVARLQGSWLLWISQPNNFHSHLTRDADVCNYSG